MRTYPPHPGLGSRGIVPLISVWMPGVDPILGMSRPPEIDYYRRMREAFAEIYDRYQLVPPGIPAGAHVSKCGMCTIICRIS
jgi:hypothetical protein